jgi:hypothetical protein
LAGRGFEELCDPEVEQLYVAVGRQDCIGGFDVAMDHATSMGCCEAEGDLEAYLVRLGPVDGDRESIEALATNEFGDEVGISLDLANAVDGDDVGMLETSDGSGFDEKPRAGWDVGPGRGDELDGHEAVEGGVASEVHFAHAASS